MSGILLPDKAALARLGTFEVAGVSSVEFLDIFADGFQKIIIVGQKIRSTGTSYNGMVIQLKSGGAYISSGYYGHQYVSGSGQNTSNSSASMGNVSFWPGVGAQCGELALEVVRPGDTDHAKHIFFRAAGQSNAFAVGAFHLQTNMAAVEGLKLIPNSVDTINGVFDIYGQKAGE